MSFVSYAENFQDVLLWRALADVGTGFYIDVGAGDPQHHSVTHAFYQRGWRGVNIEPAAGLLRRLRIERPADINLATGVSDKAGQADFYELQGSGLSTFDAARAARLGDAGGSVLLRHAELQTLDAICAAHPLPAIHFLHIHVNGDEQAVLDGFDLQRWQPWIIVIRADATPRPWMAALREAGYVAAHFDGENHFFTAPGHSRLQQALALPPHVGDDFILCEGHTYGFPLDEWRQRTAAAESDADQARVWAKAHVREWQEKYAQLTEQQEMTRRAEAELATAQAQTRSLLLQAANTEAQLQQRAEAAEGQIPALLQRAAAAEGQIPPLTARAVHAGVVELELAAVYASTSWRMTAPVRFTRLLPRRVKNVLRRRIKGLRAFAFRAVKYVLRRALQFVLSRPALAFFLRRQVSRFPGLVRIARGLLIRSRQPEPGPAAPSASTDLSQLPDAAHHVFNDLRRVRR